MTAHKELTYTLARSLPWAKTEHIFFSLANVEFIYALHMECHLFLKSQVSQQSKSVHFNRIVYTLNPRSVKQTMMTKHHGKVLATTARQEQRLNEKRRKKDTHSARFHIQAHGMPIHIQLRRQQQQQRGDIDSSSSNKIHRNIKRKKEKNRWIWKKKHTHNTLKCRRKKRTKIFTYKCVLKHTALWWHTSKRRREREKILALLYSNQTDCFHSVLKLLV